jgi:hypothetical protein
LKTNQDQPTQSAVSNKEQSPSELDNLIQRPRARKIVTPEKVDGIVIGTLCGFTDTGEPLVQVEELGLSSVAAQALIEIDATHIAQQVALGFQGGNPCRPIVLGFLHQPTTENEFAETSQAHQEIEIIEQGRRIVIEAEQELELRCGEAVILLAADGHIQLRGGYITSHADATQRIRGGSVQIN